MKFAIKFSTVFGYLFGIFCIVYGFLYIWNAHEGTSMGVTLIVSGIYTLSITSWLCGLQWRVEQLEKHLPQKKPGERDAQTEEKEASNSEVR